MAKIKVCPHPGALSELLKSKGMTQVDAARVSGIDRKTLAKIDRGEEVKLETLQKLANKLRVPIAHFDPPSGSSIDQVDSQLEEPGSVMLRKVDAEGLADLLKHNVSHQWQLNVHQVDDEVAAVLEQLEGAVSELNSYIQETNYRRFVATADIRPSNPDFHAREKAAATKFLGSLGQQLDGLKFFKRVADLFEELAKHRLAILGAEFLYWECTHGTDWPGTAEELPFTPYDNYVVQPTVLISIDEQSVQTRHASVDRGREPPKFAPDRTTMVIVNGRCLEIDPAVILEESELQLRLSEQKTVFDPNLDMPNFESPNASSEDGNDQ
jgi:transcriptional regulator with XRE-family HTH domain